MNMVCRPRDAALSSSSREGYLPWGSAVADVPPVRASFENLALLADRLSPAAGDLIGVLLASAIPAQNRGCEVLRPLWTEEAVHRALGFMRLVDARKRRGQSTKQNPIAAELEDFAARDLAVRFRQLQSGAERAVMPCASVLRDIVTDLGVVFACPANIALKTKIDRVSLPAYKRRALVLAACELLCNALLHAFPRHDAGLIEVCLTHRNPKSACLRVADSGIGFSDTRPNLTFGVAASLAGLLEADLAYDRAAGWTIAEIIFPVTGM
jgi:two-component sensor histidine kinase